MNDATKNSRAFYLENKQKHMRNGRNKVVFPSKRSKSSEKVKFVGLNLGKRFLQ